MKKRINFMTFALLILSFLACVNLAISQEVPSDAKLQKMHRMRWWTDATFGMFIHWGLYSEAAGYWDEKPVKGAGEWIMNTAKIPRKQYEKLAGKFNPNHFNADYWVRVAKNAGMKYLVITSKHHEGFAMFNTSTTHYNVVDDTPWHTDPMKALAKACKKYGIKFGFYYSIMDWHSPYQLAHDNSDPEHPTYNPTKIKPGKKADYIKYMKTQLTELINQYHPAILWFDGEWVNWWTKKDGQKLYNYLRTLDPDLIINNRIGKRHTGPNAVGDFGTPEQEIPPNGIPDFYWETCMTINDTWGYKRDDHDFKSDTTLIRNLIDIASKGGNYLLNVGPTAQGIIPLPEVTRLAAMGQWLDIYGKAIYGTKASPYKKEFDWGRVTRKKARLFLEVFHWPKDGKLTLPLYKGYDVVSAYLIDDPSRAGVEARQDGNHLVVSLPGRMPNEIASVVEIDFK